MKRLGPSLAIALLIAPAIAQSPPDAGAMEQEIQSEASRQKSSTVSETYFLGSCGASAARDTTMKCYFDSAGRWHHSVYEEDWGADAGTDFWGRKKKPMPKKSFVLLFAYIRDRQVAYNDWIRHARSDQPDDGRYCVRGAGETVWDFRCLETIPSRLMPIGTLTIDTLMIPYFEGAQARYVALHSWGQDCSQNWTGPDQDHEHSWSPVKFCTEHLDALDDSLQLRYQAIQSLQEDLDAYKALVEKLKPLATEIDYDLLTDIQHSPLDRFDTYFEHGYIDVELIPSETLTQLDQAETAIQQSAALCRNLQKASEEQNAPATK